MQIVHLTDESLYHPKLREVQILSSHQINNKGLIKAKVMTLSNNFGVPIVTHKVSEVHAESIRPFVIPRKHLKTYDVTLIMQFLQK